MIVVSRERLVDVYNVIRSFVTNSSDTNEIAVHFNDNEGAAIYIMDGSKACMTNIELLPEWFDVYKPVTDVVAFDYSMLSNVVSFSGKDSKITFEKDKTENRVKVKLSNGEANYELKFITIDKRNIREVRVLTKDRIEAIKSKCNGYNVPVYEISKIFGNMKLYTTVENNGVAYFSVNESNELTLIVGEEDTGTGSLTSKLMVFEISKITPIIKSMYGIMYLQNLKSEIDVLDKNEMYIQMHIGNGMPIVAEMAIHNNTGFITFVLAPRIESE